MNKDKYLKYLKELYDIYKEYNKDELTIFIFEQIILIETGMFDDAVKLTKKDKELDNISKNKKGIIKHEKHSGICGLCEVSTKDPNNFWDNF